MTICWGASVQFLLYTLPEENLFGLFQEAEDFKIVYGNNCLLCVVTSISFLLFFSRKSFCAGSVILDDSEFYLIGVKYQELIIKCF